MSAYTIRREYRNALAAAIAAEDWWWREAHHQRQETQRWQQRIELAERSGDPDLATEAARRARHHAAQARSAELTYAEQRTRVRMLKDEARVQAGATVTRPIPQLPAQDPLEQRFAALERETVVDAQLQELKARMASTGPAVATAAQEAGRAKEGGSQT